MANAFFIGRRTDGTCFLCVVQAENGHVIDHVITSTDHDWWRRSTPAGFPIILHETRASTRACMRVYIRAHIYIYVDMHMSQRTLKRDSSRYPGHRMSSGRMRAAKLRRMARTDESGPRTALTRDFNDLPGEFRKGGDDDDAGRVYTAAIPLS